MRQLDASCAKILSILRRFSVALGGGADSGATERMRQCKGWLGALALWCVCGAGLMMNGSITWASERPAPDAGTFDLPASPQSSEAAPGHQVPFSIRAVYEHKEPAEKPAHGVVGLNLLIQQGRYPVVHGVYSGTPAARQGLQTGDRILFINGVTTMGKTVTEVDAMISDVPGETVAFTLQRGARMVPVHLTVAAVESLSPQVRPAFSGLFGSVP